MRIKRRVSIIVIVLFISVMVFSHACMTFRMSSKEVKAFIDDNHLHARQEQYSINGREIHYVTSGDASKPAVLFVHGSPGSLSAFIDFLADSTLLQNFLLITTDRPGFGYSNFGNAEPSLVEQAAMLKPILEKYKNIKPLILVGHSLGGPVIARMAMDYPTLVDGLVIVAGSIDPALEPNETWFRAPLATPFLSWVLPRSFRASNEEIYQLKPQLTAMLSMWKTITCPVIVIQGSEDDLVDPRNADFAKKMIKNAPVELMLKKDMNHFVPWSHPELIREAVMQFKKPKGIKGTRTQADN